MEGVELVVQAVRLRETGFVQAELRVVALRGEKTVKQLVVQEVLQHVVWNLRLRRRSIRFTWMSCLPTPLPARRTLQFAHVERCGRRVHVTVVSGSCRLTTSSGSSSHARSSTSDQSGASARVEERRSLSDLSMTRGSWPASARSYAPGTHRDMDSENDEEDVAWVTLQRRCQGITHVAPVGDVIRHRMLIDGERPLRLRDGIVLSCPCQPSVCIEPNGTRVVLHRMLATRGTAPPLL